MMKYIELDPNVDSIAFTIGSACACTSGETEKFKKIKMMISRKGKNCSCSERNYDYKGNCGCITQSSHFHDKPLVTLPLFEIDEDGRHVFKITQEVYKLKKGWYIATFLNDCTPCSSITMRVGKRCEVFNFESFNKIAGCDGCPPFNENSTIVQNDPRYAPRKIVRQTYDCRD